MAKKKDNTLLYAGIAAAAILLLKKKDTGMAGIGARFAKAIINAYPEACRIVDLDKGFFELDSSTLWRLGELKKKYKYSGDNPNRSPLVQFYLRLQDYHNYIRS